LVAKAIPTTTGGKYGSFARGAKLTKKGSFVGSLF
jgi:hypothetical protein